MMMILFLHHPHQVMLTARIPLTLTPTSLYVPVLFTITPSNSCWQYPVFAQNWWMHIFAGWQMQLCLCLRESPDWFCSYFSSSDHNVFFVFLGKYMTVQLIFWEMILPRYLQNSTKHFCVVSNNDLRFLANALALAQSPLHNPEQATRSTGLCINSH